MRGVLLIEHDLSGDREHARHLLDQHEGCLDAGAGLILLRDFDDVVGLRSTLGGLIRLILCAARSRRAGAPGGGRVSFLF